MAALNAIYVSNLSMYLKSMRADALELSIETLVSLLKRRQIRTSRPCAIATAHLLLRIVAKSKWTTVEKLLEHIQHVGQRLTDAQPREMVVGNIVRRVLGMIRDEAEEHRTEDASDSASNGQMDSPHRERDLLDLSSFKPEGWAATISPRRVGAIGASDIIDNPNADVLGVKSKAPRPPLLSSHTSYAVLNGVPVQQSMFNLLSANPSPSSTPTAMHSPHGKSSLSATSLVQKIATSPKDLKAEVINGIEEIIDELDQVDDQIAAYAQEHIHSNEVILTHSASVSVQKFLLKAAEKRKFTVIIAESCPNEQEATHLAVVGQSPKTARSEEVMLSEAFSKPLSVAGITVILVTDAAIFAIMSRVNKVILATHAVIANGGLIAAAGARIIAKAAKVHRTPVIVVSGVYKLSPEYPFEFDSLIEYGDPGKIVGYHEGRFLEHLEVDNPVYDYVPHDLVDLYITNLGAHAPSYLYRIVADHYMAEDINPVIHG